jgi:hypothetical protein
LCITLSPSVITKNSDARIEREKREEGRCRFSRAPQRENELSKTGARSPEAGDADEEEFLGQVSWIVRTRTVLISITVMDLLIVVNIGSLDERARAPSVRCASPIITYGSLHSCNTPTQPCRCSLQDTWQRQCRKWTDSLTGSSRRSSFFLHRHTGTLDASGKVFQRFTRQRRRGEGKPEGILSLTAPTYSRR